MGRHKKHEKTRGRVLIPTPFGAANVSGTAVSHTKPDAPSGGHLCMFPGCSARASSATCDDRNTLSIKILALPDNPNLTDLASPRLLTLVSCDSHGHLMRARGLKKDMELQQFSHMRNVYTTLHQLVQESCKSILQEIGEF